MHQQLLDCHYLCKSYCDNSDKNLMSNMVAYLGYLRDYVAVYV